MDTNATFYKYLSDQLAYNSQYDNTVEDLLDNAYNEIDKYVRTSGSTHASHNDLSPQSLKRAIHDANLYPIKRERIEISTLQLVATGALQFHIEFYNGDINEYYQSQGMKVKQ